MFTNFAYKTSRGNLWVDLSKSIWLWNALSNNLTQSPVLNRTLSSMYSHITPAHHTLYEPSDPSRNLFHLVGLGE
jgi:hypothetical protein